MLGWKMLQKSPKRQKLAQSKSSPDNNMVTKNNHHSVVRFFDHHSPQPGNFFRDKILLKKKNLGEMLIEQTIEFE